MRRHQKVLVSIYDDQKFRKLDFDSKFLFLYLLTCKHSNLIGLFLLPITYIIRDLFCLDETLSEPFQNPSETLSEPFQNPSETLSKAFRKAYERVLKALRNLIESQLIAYDWENETIWIKNWLKHKPLDNPNKIKGAVTALGEIPNSLLFSEFSRFLEEKKPKGFETLLKAFRNPFETLSKQEEEEVEVEVKEILSFSSGTSEVSNECNSDFKKTPLLDKCNSRKQLSSRKKFCDDESKQIFDLPGLWNEKVKNFLPLVTTVTQKRKTAIKARLKEKPDPEYWAQVIDRILKSRFCLGESNTNWRANFDWLLRPDTHVRVMEGRYDNLSMQSNSKYDRNMSVLKKAMQKITAEEGEEKNGIKKDGD